MRLQFVLGDATHDHSQTLAESVKKYSLMIPAHRFLYGAKSLEVQRRSALVATVE